MLLFEAVLSCLQFLQSLGAANILSNLLVGTGRTSAKIRTRDVSLTRPVQSSKNDKLYLGYRHSSMSLARVSKKAAERVLVVDNEPEVALTIKIGLEREAISSDVYIDPMKALKQFRRHSGHYFLVLSDIRMVKMSGFELVRHIRSIRPETNIILMTAFEIDKSEFVKVFPSTNVDDFLQKPFSMGTLNNLVHKYSERRLKNV
jgi:CheY-like chemotaxis protein